MESSTSELALIDWATDVNNVQNIWDEFESKLVKVVDKIVPLTEFDNIKRSYPPYIAQNHITHI